MPVISAIFWLLGLVFSVTIAPQLRIWTWGPAMSCIAVAVISALPYYWRKKSSCSDSLLLISGSLLVIWLGVRAATSPVEELAQADGLLMAMAVATFVCFRSISGNAFANHILIVGLALVLLASVVVIAMQVADPFYSPIFPNDEPRSPSGFFAHYSYGAAFLIPTSLLLLSQAFHDHKHWSMKIFLGAIAIAGCVAVFFTKSRSGFIGLGFGFMTFLILSIIATRHHKKTFVILIFTVPFLLLATVALFTTGLVEILQRRGGTSSLTAMLDNAGRFYLINIAYSCIALHPFAGGGSRSYSWECFQFWNNDEMGRGLLKPEHVHNELIQTASDYGIVGVILLLIFVLVVLISGIFFMSSPGIEKGKRKLSAWNVGGISGFLGLFAQSNFEGILRLPTGAIMLGFCFAAACFYQPKEISRSFPVTFSRSILTFFGLLSASLLAKFGWQGTQATRSLWQGHFGEMPMDIEARVDCLTAGIAEWPLGSLYFERGTLHQTLASRNEKTELASDYVEKAISDYNKASVAHPFHPEASLNSAILLSSVGRMEEAEQQFTRAVRNQGKMESAFHAHRDFASHLQKKGHMEFRNGDKLAALNTLERAAKHADLMAEIQASGFVIGGEQKLRVQVRESYGRALEELGQYADALNVYDQTSELRWGESSHYRAGALLGSRAAVAWSDGRSEDALALFIRAQERCTKAGGRLPLGVTKENRNKYLNYLGKTIAYLQGAGVEPAENPKR